MGLGLLPDRHARHQALFSRPERSPPEPRDVISRSSLKRPVKHESDSNNHSMSTTGRRAVQGSQRRRTPAPRPTSFGKRLRSLREAASLSQAELGRPYYTRSYMSSIELGRVDPSLKAIAFLADRLGVTVGTLVDPPASTPESSNALHRALEALGAVPPRKRSRLVTLAIQATTAALQEAREVRRRSG